MKSSLMQLDHFFLNRKGQTSLFDKLVYIQKNISLILVKTLRHETKEPTKSFKTLQKLKQLAEGYSDELKGMLGKLGINQEYFFCSDDARSIDQEQDKALITLIEQNPLLSLYFNNYINLLIKRYIKFINLQAVESQQDQALDTNKEIYVAVYQANKDYYISSLLIALEKGMLSDIVKKVNQFFYNTASYIAVMKLNDRNANDLVNEDATLLADNIIDKCANFEEAFKVTIHNQVSCKQSAEEKIIKLGIETTKTKLIGRIREIQCKIDEKILSTKEAINHLSMTEDKDKQKLCIILNSAAISLWIEIGKLYESKDQVVKFLDTMKIIVNKFSTTQAEKYFHKALEQKLKQHQSKEVLDLSDIINTLCKKLINKSLNGKSFIERLELDRDVIPERKHSKAHSRTV